MKGRIYFPGNPWPEGHPIKELVWTARIDTEAGLWFDLHLESEDYYAERYIEDEDDGVADSDFEAPIAWGNFHACTLSSNKWNTGGWLVGDDEAPLSFAGLVDRTFIVDDLDSPEFEVDDLDERAFHIYLLGHDDVAGHEIRFAPESTPGWWSLDWRGQIALAYMGDFAFRYTFRVEARELSFSGFELEVGMTEADARAFVRRWCQDAGELSLAVGSDARYLRSAG